MFATLDPTSRAELPSKRKILFSDTVGFIRHLPHTLVSRSAQRWKKCNGDAHSASLGCEQSGVGGAGRAGGERTEGTRSR